jgi:ankyrin repeat protein
MSSSLPVRPNLEWLRKTAKERLSEIRTTEPNAKLADAQLALAREYGFPSWRRLRAHVEALAAKAADAKVDEVSDEFFLNVGTGAVNKVRAMLAANPALVNVVGPHPFWGGRPQALHVAIEGKRRDMFDLLLEYGADVNGSNDEYDHWSPLMLAVNRDRPDMQQALLERGARIGLLEGLLLGDDTRVEELLRAGRLPAIAPNRGSFLAFARTPFAIDRLIALGAQTDMKDRWGSTPIDALSRMGPKGTALVRHMIGRGIVAAPKEYARLGDLETLARLVKSDPSIVKLDSVMMAAVDFRHYEIVKWLLARGADVNARSDAESRHTALHSAAWNGDLEMVMLLVHAGADRHARDAQYDSTPEGWAETSIEVSNNPACAEVVEYLRTLNAR